MFHAAKRRSGCAMRGTGNGKESGTGYETRFHSCVEWDVVCWWCGRARAWCGLVRAWCGLARTWWWCNLAQNGASGVAILDIIVAMAAVRTHATESGPHAQRDDLDPRHGMWGRECGRVDLRGYGRDRIREL